MSLHPLVTPWTVPSVADGLYALPGGRPLSADARKDWRRTEELRLPTTTRLLPSAVTTTTPREGEGRVEAFRSSLGKVVHAVLFGGSPHENSPSSNAQFRVTFNTSSSGSPQRADVATIGRATPGVIQSYSDSAFGFLTQKKHSPRFALVRWSCKQKQPP